MRESAPTPEELESRITGHKESSLSLYLAIADGDTGVVRDLISSGADVNAMNLCVGSPLHFATSSGKTEIAQTLISAGADIEAKHDPGKVPFLNPETRNSFETERDRIIVGLKLAEEHLEGQTPLHMAVSHGWVDVVHVIISAGAELIANRQSRKYPAVYCHLWRPPGAASYPAGCRGRRRRQTPPRSPHSSAQRGWERAH